MRELRERMFSEEGLTVTEVIVVTIILGIALVTFYSFLAGGERASSDGRDWIEANQDARLAIERMTRELREGDLIVSVNPPAGKTEISFQADLDESGTFATGTYVVSITADEVINYEYDAGEDVMLISTQDDPTQRVLADHIVDFGFTYFGSDPALDIGCSGFKGTDPPGCAAGDGVVMWQEIDWASEHSPPIQVGTSDGILNSELNFVTSIEINMTVGVQNQRHSHRGGVELRNLFK